MKDIKKIFLLIICCFININFCYALDYAGVTLGYNDSSSDGADGGVSGDTDDDGKINGQYSLGGGYTCYYDYGLNYNSDIKIYGFNQNNKDIISGKVTPNELTKAGTSIGISIIETKSASWEYDLEVKQKIEICKSINPMYKYKCTVYFSYFPYSKTEEKIMTESAANSKGNCTKVSNVVQSYADETCSESEKTIDDEKKEDDCGLHVLSIVSSKAKNYVVSPSYKNIKLLNPNNADTTDGSIAISTKGCASLCGDKGCSCTHTYTPMAVCMNKITSEVYYRDTENCGDNEFKIENDIVDGVEHFHYFVPMNVTSGSFSLILSESGDRQENEWCKDRINDNPTNFYDFFVGVRANGETFRFSDNITTAINSLDYGCYIRSEIRIPVSKGLYNVEDNKIKGYNLYVKNVDPYNPFPNPVTNLNSLWFDWYNGNYSVDADGKRSYTKFSGNAPNIKESFKEISYEIQNVNAKKIRDLKLGNYLSSNLNPNGTSGFIRERDDITFSTVANTNTFYKLGCGLLNYSLYQEECK